MSSCKGRENVEKNIRSISANPVMIKESEMTTWMPNGNPNTVFREDKAYSAVIYANSTQCTPCFIKKLKEWNDMITTANANVRFVFIIEPRQGESNILCDMLEESGFSHKVLIDANNSFRKSNPHIPKDAMYHTFLLDEDNKVVLVGNPLRNNRIKEIFLRTVNKKQ